MGKQAVQQNPEAPKTELPVSKETTDMARVSSEATNGSWFTPIRGALNLSNFQDGFLSSAFMIGLIVASPIFASLVKRLVGVGIAPFVSIGAPYIDDIAPLAQKATWLGIFYTCIPAGFSVGYVYGGLVGFLAKPLKLKDDSTGEDGAKRPVKEEFIDQDSKGPSKIFVMASVQAHSSRFVKDLKVLLLDKVYVVNVLGNIAYNLSWVHIHIGGPKLVMKNADMIFGGVTMVCGIVGTLAGGFVLDRMTSTISNAFKLLAAATFIGGALCFSAFCFKSLYVFIALFTVGELLLFGTQGPVNFICLQCVQPSMRPISMAMSVVAIHVFGDVPSAPLVGVLQDYLNDWRKTTLILTSILFLAAIIWFIGIFLYKGGKSNGDSENQVAMVGKSNETPLVDEMAIERTNSSPANP
ncbi:hypothetical protein RHSIM_Rhsim06G0207000 [Rhododendron simsii]|uniref:Major facilitator superfamily (MFS) profile domain-containing protein n=1 Tax=Rhododendron simsii TaxID=118357 RepID=A0A834GSF1_RHOSS|nr:hypothetical protein RHSIM_Rhsim06G0207000 [Rhododendron simsii]